MQIEFQSSEITIAGVEGDLKAVGQLFHAGGLCLRRGETALAHKEKRDRSDPLVSYCGPTRSFLDHGEVFGSVEL